MAIEIRYLHLAQIPPLARSKGNKVKYIQERPLISRNDGSFFTSIQPKEMFFYFLPLSLSIFTLNKYQFGPNYLNLKNKDGSKNYRPVFQGHGGTRGIHKKRRRRYSDRLARGIPSFVKESV